VNGDSNEQHLQLSHRDKAHRNPTPDTAATKGVTFNEEPSAEEAPTAPMSSTSGARRKFVTLSQLTLPIPGRAEKLFLVEDVTVKINTTEIMEQRAEFGSFTEYIMDELEEYVTTSRLTLRDISKDVLEIAKPELHKLDRELCKLRLRILDYRTIYQIADDEFKDPVVTAVDPQDIIEHVRRSVKNDLDKINITPDFSTNYQTVQKPINCFKQLLVQVIHNMMI